MRNGEKFPISWPKPGSRGYHTGLGLSNQSHGPQRALSRNSAKSPITSKNSRPKGSSGVRPRSPVASESTATKAARAAPALDLNSFLHSQPQSMTSASRRLRQARRTRFGRQYWRHLIFQSLTENLPHVIYKDKPNVFKRLLRHFLKVAAISRGQNNLGHSGPPCRQDFLLDAPDRQHVAAQGYLPRHGYVLAHRSVRQRRNQGAGQRNPRRGAVLGNRALGNMNVHVIVAEILRINLKFFGAGLRIGIGRLRGLPHHLA